MSERRRERDSMKEGGEAQETKYEGGKVLAGEKVMV